MSQEIAQGREEMNRMLWALADLREATGKDPTEFEIAAASGLDVDRVRELLLIFVYSLAQVEGQ